MSFSVEMVDAGLNFWEITRSRESAWPSTAAVATVHDCRPLVLSLPLIGLLRSEHPSLMESVDTGDFHKINERISTVFILGVNWAVHVFSAESLGRRKRPVFYSLVAVFTGTLYRLHSSNEWLIVTVIITSANRTICKRLNRNWTSNLYNSKAPVPLSGCLSHRVSL